MPIRPENKALYPKNWPEIRAKILLRAHDRCESCQSPNHQKIYRDAENQWHHIDPRGGSDRTCYDDQGIPRKVIRIVLTIAHLYHNPRHSQDENLASLCQRCHNRLDVPDRIAGRRRRYHQAAAIGDLFSS